MFAPWKKSYDKLDSILKSRDITLPTKVHIVKPMDFPGGSVVKNPPANAGDGDVGSIPGSGRFPGGGNGNTLQYSCLENPMDRGAW